MGWIFLFIAAFTIMFVLVPISKLKQLWYAGVIGIIVLLPIERTFIMLGAIKYYNLIINIHGVSLFYILSVFAGGVLIINYYPTRKLYKFPFVLLISLIFIGIEAIMLYTGHMAHSSKWDLFNSYILNIFGFIVFIWLSEWVGTLREKIK